MLVGTVMTSMQTEGTHSKNQKLIKNFSFKIVPNSIFKIISET